MQEKSHKIGSYAGELELLLRLGGQRIHLPYEESLLLDGLAGVVNRICWQALGPFAFNAVASLVVGIVNRAVHFVTARAEPALLLQLHHDTLVLAVVHDFDFTVTRMHRCEY